MPYVVGLVAVVIAALAAMFLVLKGCGMGSGNGGDGDHKVPLETPAAPSIQAPEQVSVLEIIVRGDQYVIAGRIVALEEGVIPAIRSAAEEPIAKKIKIICDGARELQYSELIETCKKLGISWVDEGC